MSSISIFKGPNLFKWDFFLNSDILGKWTVQIIKNHLKRQEYKISSGDLNA